MRNREKHNTLKRMMTKTPVQLFDDVSEKSQPKDTGIDQKLNTQKQTVLERRVTFLAINRTLMIFFLVVFSTPFFINTSYRQFADEY